MTRCCNKAAFDTNEACSSTACASHPKSKYMCHEIHVHESRYCARVFQRFTRTTAIKKRSPHRRKNIEQPPWDEIQTRWRPRTAFIIGKFCNSTQRVSAQPAHRRGAVAQVPARNANVRAVQHEGTSEWATKLARSNPAPTLSPRVETGRVLSSAFLASRGVHSVPGLNVSHVVWRLLSLKRGTWKIDVEWMANQRGQEILFESSIDAETPEYGNAVTVTGGFPGPNRPINPPKIQPAFAMPFMDGWGYEEFRYNETNAGQRKATRAKRDASLRLRASTSRSRGNRNVSCSPAAAETAQARSDTGCGSIPVFCERRPWRRRQQEQEKGRGKKAIRTESELDYSKASSKLEKIWLSLKFSGPNIKSLSGFTSGLPYRGSCERLAVRSTASNLDMMVRGPCASIYVDGSLMGDQSSLSSSRHVCRTSSTSACPLILLVQVGDPVIS
ncbi:hypothetical protein DFH09DRAFT_1446732 [Mycena vulgaris]|nr:hypothetical protein DFH09DRAFT_1446732 [Mycena vulgaris]